MKQVALNLITNALGSVEPGGTVRLTWNETGDFAELRVADDGCGMTEEIKTTPCSNPSLPVDGTAREPAWDSRLLIKSLKNTVAGSLPYSDGPGKGSTFTVRLPLVKNEQSNVRNAA